MSRSASAIQSILLQLCQITMSLFEPTLMLLLFKNLQILLSKWRTNTLTHFVAWWYRNWKNLKQDSRMKGQKVTRRMKIERHRQILQEKTKMCKQLLLASARQHQSSRIWMTILIQDTSQKTSNPRPPNLNKVLEVYAGLMTHDVGKVVKIALKWWFCLPNPFNIMSWNLVHNQWCHFTG